MNPPVSIFESLKLIVPACSVVELRILHARLSNSYTATVAGYFNDLEKMAAAAERWNRRAPGVYCTLNPVLPDLLARASNRVIEKAKVLTTDAEVLRRKRLLLDFDPMRPSNISATEDEHRLGLERARACREFLSGLSWPRPILADSGNGGHVEYAIDLPNDEDSRELIKRVLGVLAIRFSDSRVKLDQTMFNAARISKVYGTLAMKGDSIPERPHRLARILEAPDVLEPVTPHALEGLANSMPAAGANGNGKVASNGRGFSFPMATGGKFDLDAWLQKYSHLLPPLRPWRDNHGDGRKREFERCPWNAEHINTAAFIIENAHGAIRAGCRHDSCSHQTWETLKALVGDAVTGKVWKEAPRVEVPRSGATSTETKADIVARLDMPFAVLDGHLGGIYVRHLTGLPIAYAWGALLTAAGVLLPREDESGPPPLRSNLFFSLVGPPHSGKSQVVTRVFHILQLWGDLVIEAKFGSGEGLLKYLTEKRHTSCLWSPDEMGHTLAKAAIQGASLPFVLNTAFYQDRQKGGTKKEAYDIDCRIALLGGVIEEDFGDAFGPSSTGGLYDRFAFGLCPDGYQFVYRPFQGDAEPIRPKLPSVAASVWDERDQWVKDGISPRVAEIALRSAYIAAAVDRRPTLVASDLRPARALAEYQRQARKVVAPNPGENPDAKCAIRIRAWMEEQGRNGEWLSRRALHKGIHAERFGPNVFNRCILAMQFNAELEIDASGRKLRLASG